VLLAIKECILLYALHFEKTPQYTLILSGQDWIDELIAGHDCWFYNEMGMQKHVFYALLSILRRDGGLHNTIPALCTSRVIQSDIARAISEKWEYYIKVRSMCLQCGISYQSSRYIYCILDTLVLQKIYSVYVKLLTWNTCLQETIMNNANFYPYFKDCVGTIDGLHIPAFIPKSKYMPFYDHKGQISQNILAACSFDFKFVYVLSGWKGSTSDSLVYQDARLTDFHIPEEKYYLVN
jgi:DDE superfamily endonuclease